MSETDATQNSESTENQDAGSSEGSAGTQVPEGFVPLATLEQEQARTRAFQSELDRVKAETAASASKPAESAGASDDDDEGFDPVAYRRELLRDVAGVSRLSRAAESLRSEFPLADASLFEDRLVDFASPEALRIAAEDSHKAVASLVDAGMKAKEADLLKTFAEQYGVDLQGEGGPQGQGQSVDGDPTPEQFNRLSFAEQDALEAKSPGITQRIIDKATRGQGQ